MRPDLLKYFTDIREAILDIREFTNDKKSFSEFIADKMSVSATERKLEIIGESVHRILKKDPKIEISNSKQIIQFRNRLAHEYDQIDYALVWDILTNHLSYLQEEVDLLINNFH